MRGLAMDSGIMPAGCS